MKIIEYTDSRYITVEFQDEFMAKVHTNYQWFYRGLVKNPYHPSTFGVGYMGQGQYTSKNCPYYIVWQGMLERCYSINYLQKYPTYVGCTVCESWKNFQNFAAWCETNYYLISGMKIHLDKDILHKGNKIYSPKNCVFVPERINTMFTKSRHARGKYPIGVNKYTRSEKYVARLNMDGASRHIGHYDTPIEAFYAYKESKERYIKQVADEYMCLIPPEVYAALYTYEVEITD